MKVWILTLATLALAGCETSAVWYHSHPEKRVIAIDGREVSVVPRGENKWDAWGGDDGTKTNAAALKARQIKAIEQASSCNVSAAEYSPSGPLLQAVVTCPSASR
jgi:hypothetical protein